MFLFFLGTTQCAASPSARSCSSFINLLPRIMKIHQLFIHGFLSLFLMFNVVVRAQNQSNQNEFDAVSNFQPSLAVVIAILSIMFSLTLLLLLYAKYCHRSSSSSSSSSGSSSVQDQNHHLQNIQDGLLRGERSRSSSGIDKTVIQSLPFFRFSSLKGSREGLECSICLSRFEDVEILRLLPKCKHGFHIDCLDRWLEKHSSCPLCRNKVSADYDLSALNFSNSLRFLWNVQSDRKEDSGIELYIQREGSRRRGGGTSSSSTSSFHSSSSSRFSSFRKTDNHNNNKGKKKEEEEEELPIQIEMHQWRNSDENYEDDRKEKDLHKFNHRIVVSDVVLKHRWSNVNASDLMLLNSEMIQQISSNRFSELEIINKCKSDSATATAPTKSDGDGEILNLKEEIGRKREFESKLMLQSKMKQNIIPAAANNESETKTEIWESSSSKALLNQNEKRSMSEIIVHSRFKDFSNRNAAAAMRSNGGSEPSPSSPENTVNEERIRKLWLPIARRTVEWFANRERRTISNSNV